MKQDKDSRPKNPGGRRPLDYVIVAASPWVKGKVPSRQGQPPGRPQVGMDQPSRTEPDLEAEP